MLCSWSPGVFEVRVRIQDHYFLLLNTTQSIEINSGGRLSTILNLFITWNKLRQHFFLFDHQQAPYSIWIVVRSLNVRPENVVAIALPEVTMYHVVTPCALGYQDSYACASNSLHVWLNVRVKLGCPPNRYPFSSFHLIQTSGPLTGEIGSISNQNRLGQSNGEIPERRQCKDLTMTWKATW